MKRGPVVTVLGTHHMANPGRDAVNFQADDVLRPERQTEVLELVNRLERFKPTKVAVEVSPSRDAEYERKYHAYLQGTHPPERSEVYQLGFRLAKRMGHNKVYPIDWSEPAPAGVDIDFEAFASEFDQGDLLADARREAQCMAERDQEVQSKGSLLDLYRINNDPDNLLAMHRLYFKIARIGAEDCYPGANWVQHWYGRNLKVFINVTRLVESDGERILVIIGAGHAWLLRQFVEEDGYFVMEDPLTYLSE